MGWQTVAAALLVLACSGYALWTLMPATLRARLRPGRPAASACGGCGGCGPAAPAQAQQQVHIVRRPPSA